MKEDGAVAKQESSDMEINGIFNVKRFYETLARILSRKANLPVAVTVHRDGEKEAV